MVKKKNKAVKVVKVVEKRLYRLYFEDVSMDVKAAGMIQAMNQVQKILGRRVSFYEIACFSLPR